MKHLVEDMAIDKRGQFYYVVDKKTGKTYGVKYQDEEHAMRYIKYLCNFKRDWRFMEVDKLYKPKPEIKEEIIVSKTQTEPSLQAALEIKEKPEMIQSGQYWCNKCTALHRENSKIGEKHLKYKEV